MWQLIEPYLLEILGLILTAILSMVARQFHVWTGVKIEEKHLKSLHTALITGAEAALANRPGLHRRRVIEAAINHARRSVPDALRNLNPTEDVLDHLAARFANDAIDRF